MGDFGLATALPQEQNDVLYGSENCLYKKHTAQVGTQLYMSPEQVSITMDTRTLCRQMEYSIKFDTVKSGRSIVYNEGKIVTVFLSLKIFLF